MCVTYLCKNSGGKEGGRYLLEGGYISGRLFYISHTLHWKEGKGELHWDFLSWFWILHVGTTHIFSTIMTMQRFSKA